MSVGVPRMDVQTTAARSGRPGQTHQLRIQSPRRFVYSRQAPVVVALPRDGPLGVRQRPRGTAAPVVARDMALTGFDNGRVLAVTLADGATVWDSPVSPPHGRTELERLNDIDAAVKVLGDDVFVVGFQGRAAMLSIESGQIWWTRDISSYRGVDVDDDQMYISASDGALVALKRRTGIEAWRNDTLLRRSLSAPVVVGEHVVVADLDGYVHFFDRATGTIAARAKTSGDRVTNAPLTVNGIVYVISDKGEISALRGLPIETRAAQAEPAPAEAAPPAPPAPGG